MIFADDLTQVDLLLGHLNANDLGLKVFVLVQDADAFFADFASATKSNKAMALRSSSLLVMWPEEANCSSRYASLTDDESTHSKMWNITESGAISNSGGSPAAIVFRPL